MFLYEFSYGLNDAAAAIIGQQIGKLNINKAKKILGLKISNTSVEGIIKTLNILTKKYHYDNHTVTEGLSK